MSETKHTPGPWKVVTYSDGTTDTPAITAEPYGTLAETRSDIYGIDECRANAALISAAPDLLNALIECEAILDEFDANSERTMRVRAAIAKATGSAT